MSASEERGSPVRSNDVSEDSFIFSDDSASYSTYRNRPSPYRNRPIVIRKSYTAGRGNTEKNAHLDSSIYSASTDFKSKSRRKRVGSLTSRRAKSREDIFEDFDGNNDLSASQMSIRKLPRRFVKQPNVARFTSMIDKEKETNVNNEVLASHISLKKRPRRFVKRLGDSGSVYPNALKDVPIPPKRPRKRSLVSVSDANELLSLDKINSNILNLLDVVNKLASEQKELPTNMKATYLDLIGDILSLSIRDVNDLKRQMAVRSLGLKQSDVEKIRALWLDHCKKLVRVLVASSNKQ